MRGDTVDAAFSSLYLAVLLFFLAKLLPRPAPQL